MFNIFQEFIEEGLAWSAYFNKVLPDKIDETVRTNSTLILDILDKKSNKPTITHGTK